MQHIIRIILSINLVLLSACVELMDSTLLVSKTATQSDFVVQNTLVFDGFQFKTEHDVWVEGGEIKSVGKDLVVPAGIERIDGSNLSLLPGLIDMHAHLVAAGAPPWRTTLGNIERTLSANLAMGVTSVFDVGAPLGDISSWENETGLTLPRYTYAGTMFSVDDGHPSFMIESTVFWPLSAFVKYSMISEIEALDDAKEFIDDHKAAGVSMIKVVMDEIPLKSPMIQQKLFNNVVSYAQEQGLKVVAHIGAEPEILKGIEANVDLFVHGPYRSSVSPSTINKLKASGIPMVPTSVIWDQLALFYKRDVKFNQMESYVLDAEIKEAYGSWPDELELDVSIVTWFEKILEFRQEKFAILNEMHKAGIPLFVGSDSPSVANVAGAAVHKELALWREHTEINSADILSAATGLSGKWLESYLGWKVGQIKPGYDADLLLVNGDVSKDITVTQKIERVWIVGQQVESAYKYETN